MTRIVAWYEFLFTVKRPAYLIVTFGLPVFIAIYFAFVMLITAGTARYVIDGLSASIGVVDESGLLEHARAFEAVQADQKEKRATPESEIEAAAKRLEAFVENVKPDESKKFATLVEARKALDAGDIEVIVHVPSDYVESGEIGSYSRKWKILGAVGAPQRVRRRLRFGVLQKAGLSHAEMAVVQSGRKNSEGFGAVTLHEIGPDGEFVEVDVLSRTISFAMPAGIAGVLIMALMVNAGFLVAGIAEEKENKVIEVLLSMVRVEQLLMGKVLGLSAAALLQMLVWGAMAGPIPFVALAMAGKAFEIDLSILGLLASGLFFLLGFVFYGALLVGLGSLGNNIKESQQFSMYIMLLPIVPMIACIGLLNSPNGILARTLGWLPFFSAPAMMIRLASGEVPWWDVVVAALLLALGIWGSVRVSARLFRVGTLMRGQTMNPIKLFRMFLQAGK